MCEISILGLKVYSSNYNIKDSLWQSIFLKK